MRTSPCMIIVSSATHWSLARWARPGHPALRISSLYASTMPCRFFERFSHVCPVCQICEIEMALGFGFHYRVSDHDGVARPAGSVWPNHHGHLPPQPEHLRTHRKPVVLVHRLHDCLQAPDSTFQWNPMNSTSNLATTSQTSTNWNNWMTYHPTLPLISDLEPLLLSALNPPPADPEPLTALAVWNASAASRLWGMGSAAHLAPSLKVVVLEHCSSLEVVVLEHCSSLEVVVLDQDQDHHPTFHILNLNLKLV